MSIYLLYIVNFNFVALKYIAIWQFDMKREESDAKQLISWVQAQTIYFVAANASWDASCFFEES